MAPHFSLIIRDRDLQNTRHAAGGIDSRPSSLRWCPTWRRADHYLKDSGDILGQSGKSADTVLAKGGAEGGVVRGLEELVLEPTLQPLSTPLQGEEDDAAHDSPDSESMDFCLTSPSRRSN